MKWKKILVVYYSRVGNTKKLAEELAWRLHADLEEIKTTEEYNGFFGYQRALLHGFFDVSPKIERMKKNIADYDLVVIGGPIWGGSMSGPIRSFITKYKDKLNNVAFFSSQGGKYGRKNLFTQMQYITGLAPWGTLAVTEKELSNGAFIKSCLSFASKLQHGVPKSEKRISRKRRYVVAHAQH